MHREENPGMDLFRPDPKSAKASIQQKKIEELRQYKRQKFLGTDTDDLRRIFLKERPIS